ncbi:glycosyltransferase [Arthrobacter sp. NPDC058192]|uniref:glycosyltransferase n=1 Tax=Arthrobacter sp. NPDC058192 TaxID=3346372 RepID=UPI0036E2B148
MQAWSGRAAVRIVHIVTYVSADGAFGGPIAVAISQLTELARQGHDVELMAGWDGEAVVQAEGVKVTLFKVLRVWPHGFSGLWAPGLARAAHARARSGAVVHIHLARDLITLPAARAVSRHVRPVVQTHGMVMPDGRLLARLLDRLLTREVLSRARSVLALTAREQLGLEEVAGGPVVVARVANGISVRPVRELRRKSDEVLFLARLHPRKRVMNFARMSKILVDRGVPVTCVVVGPDEGDLAPLMAFVKEQSLEKSLLYEGVLPTGQAVNRLAQAAVYVLPSTAEVFPMTVLESLASGTPVVTTLDSGIAPQLAFLKAAELTDGTPESLADAVERILSGKARRDSLVSNGYKGLATTFSIEAVSAQLLALYGPQA